MQVYVRVTNFHDAFTFLQRTDLIRGQVQRRIQLLCSVLLWSQCLFKDHLTLEGIRYVLYIFLSILPALVYDGIDARFRILQSGPLCKIKGILIVTANVAPVGIGSDSNCAILWHSNAAQFHTTFSSFEFIAVAIIDLMMILHVSFNDQVWLVTSK